ncbi:NAD(P)H-dependent oxidoreductase [Aquibacillus koreensis]|uniref:NAD(P)H-dependent oxidoreductase n=1 Tax=Aquibacillus koreensis TaxID=279446 RepID=A0A9X3WRZ6_9BACI|nr:NAD(P)H-dependent oxidoreductase [Aquibacillus koreensis]MCT2535486.1 NAD(P)H-dependent oxidoreductase [Aquibacillus koreensis]MDC3422701.1 NAD(P)H-dependent oxidoreductase [Aquibacillus koreensis]
MKLVGVAGALAGWKTNVVIHHVLEAAKEIDSNIETELIDLRDVEVEFVRGEPLAYYNEDTFKVVNKILNADFLVFGTPIYQASITGALKNLLDHFEVDAFKGKVTGIITTGAVEKHFLVSEYHLKPVLAYLKGLVPTTNVFVHNDSFSDENEIIDEEVTKRIKLLANEMVDLQQKNKRFMKEDT